MNQVLYLDTLLKRYPALNGCKEQILAGYDLMEASFAAGGKLLIAGNGGSCADAEHIVGELMKGFRQPRSLDTVEQQALQEIDEEAGALLAKKLQKALPAIALSSHTALSTAFANDIDPQLGFAQQVQGYGTEKDVFLALSTSGESANVLYAAICAKAKGMKVVALTGSKESSLLKLSDVTVQVPEVEAYMVQELHLPVYHTWCLMLEDHFFRGQDR